MNDLLPDKSLSGPIKGVPPERGTLSNAFHMFTSGLNALGSIWIFALMVMINADAMGRTFFTAPIYGVNELVELSLVGIVFLQLGDATRTGRLTRSDGFFSFLLRKVQHIGRPLGAIFDFLGVVFMVIILWGSVPLLIESYELDYYVGEEGLATFAVWPIKLVIVIGCAVTLFIFAGFAYRYLKPAADLLAQRSKSGDSQ